VNTASEAVRSFACFGSGAAVYVGGTARDGRPASLSARIAQRRLLAVHARLSRFRPESELSRLNADPRTTVPASALLRRFAQAVVEAGRLSGGLVDATLLDAIEAAGYASSREGEVGLAATAIAASRGPRRAARPGPGAWRLIEVDDEAKTISRPPGLRLDSGGIAKGLAADLVGALLEGHPTYAVDCAGDMRVGGTSDAAREIGIDDPFGRGVVARFEVSAGGVATSGITRHSWSAPDGGRAHHLLDPSTGLPAYTGVVQVTALAPTALEAEALAKTALLRGPDDVDEMLLHGGAVVLDDRSFRVVPARPREPEAVAH